MFKVSSPGLYALSLFAFGALASCERQGVQAGRTTPDPRIEKAYAAAEPEFCTFQVLYSETNTVVKSRYVVVGGSKSEMLAAFAETCKKSADAPKLECGKMLASPASYPCVSTASFVDGPETTGLWSCSLAFTANDREESFTVEKTTASDAVQAAFETCAAMTDTSVASNASNAPNFTNASIVTDVADDVVPTPFPQSSPTPGPSVTPSPTPSPTPPPIYVTPSKRRDACAAAMIAEKMICKNANTYAPLPLPEPPKRHLYRTRKHS